MIWEDLLRVEKISEKNKRPWSLAAGISVVLEAGVVLVEILPRT